MIAGGFTRRLVSIGLVALGLGFLGATVFRNQAELRAFDWDVRWDILVVSLVLHLGVLAWGVFIWSRVLHHFGSARLAYPRLLRIWAWSNITRYVPGGVWQFLTAAQMSRDAGLPAVLALTSMLVHVSVTLLAAAVAAALTLPYGVAGLEFAAPWLRAVVLAASVALVHPAVLNLALRAATRLMRREVLRWNARWRDGILLLGMSLVSWVVYGGAYSLFVGSLVPLPPGAFVPLIAVNALAFTAGYLVVLAPGGVGVREAAMAVLLTPVLPIGVAAIVSVAARLWSIAAELALALGATLFIVRKESPDAGRTETETR
jgi:hypothetical protein